MISHPPEIRSPGWTTMDAAPGIADDRPLGFNRLLATRPRPASVGCSLAWQGGEQERVVGRRPPQRKASTFNTCGLRQRRLRRPPRGNPAPPRTRMPGAFRGPSARAGGRARPRSIRGVHAIAQPRDAPQQAGRRAERSLRRVANRCRSASRYSRPRDSLEFVGDLRARARGHRLLCPSMKTGGGGLFAGAGERDADIGVLDSPGPFHDAAHQRPRWALDTRMRLAPAGQWRC